MRVVFKCRPERYFLGGSGSGSGCGKWLSAELSELVRDDSGLNGLVAGVLFSATTGVLLMARLPCAAPLP